jgi:hypothetical protein
MEKIGKKKNKKNNGRFGGTNCVPILPTGRAARSVSGPVRPEIASIELAFKGASPVPAFLVLNLAAGLRSSRVSIVCRWSCSRFGGAMYVIHADDALDSLIADVHSRGGLWFFQSCCCCCCCISCRRVQSGIYVGHVLALFSPGFIIDFATCSVFTCSFYHPPTPLCLCN